jgi:hypothetical protein
MKRMPLVSTFDFSSGVFVVYKEKRHAENRQHKSAVTRLNLLARTQSPPHIIQMIKSRSDWQGMLHVWGRRQTDRHRHTHTHTHTHRPPERPWCRWEHNIKLDYTKQHKGMDWINLAQDRDKYRPVVNTSSNLRVPQNAEDFLKS